MQPETALAAQAFHNSQELNSVVLASLPLYEAYKSVLEGALAISGAKSGALYWVNRQKSSQQHSLEVRAETGICESSTTEPGMLMEVVKSKQPKYITDLKAEEWRHSDLVNAFSPSVRSVLAVPLLSHDGKVVVGVLHVVRQRPRAFTEEQQAGLSAFAEQAQSVIQRVTLASVLGDLSQKALSMRSDDLFPYVTAALADLLDVGVCSLWLVDAATQDLVLTYAAGRPIKNRHGQPIRISRESFLGQALDSELPIYSANIQQEKTFRYRDYAKEQGWVSTLVVPIRAADGRPLGLISAYAVNEERSFTKQDRSIALIFANHVAIVLQQLALLADKERQVEIGSSVQRVSHALATAKDFNGLLHPIVTEAMGLVRSAGAILYLCDEPAKEIVVKAVAGIAECVEGMRAPLDGSLSGWVAVHNKWALCNWDDSRIDKRIAGQMGLHGPNVAAVPLAWQEHVIGTLVVLDKQGGEAAFDADDIAVLQTLATQATIALDKAQMYEAIERRAEQQRVINDILTASVSSNDIDDLLFKAAQRIHEAFGFKVALALLEQEELVFKMTIFYDGSVRRNTPILTLDKGITGQAVHTRTPVVVPDVQHTLLRYVCDHADTRSEIAVPLLTRDGQAIGVFDSESTEVHAFSEDDLPLFQSMAAGISLAIENVQRLKEHTTLRAIADVVSQAHDLRHILDNVMPTTVQLFQASACSLYLADPQAHHLRLVRHHGLPADVVARMSKLAKGQAITGAVFQEGRDMVIRDLVSDPRVAGLLLPEDGLHSMMSVPIKAHTKILGVLNVANATKRSFTDHDVELLEIVSTQVGRAIEKAQFSEQYQRLYQDASDMMFTVDRELRIIDANTRAIEVSGYQRDALLKMPLTDLMMSEDIVEQSRQRMQDILLRGANPPLLSFQIRSTTGTPLWVESSVTPLLDHTGQCVAVEAIWRDITERRRTAAVVEQRNVRLNTLLELSRIATYSSAHNDLLSQVAAGTLSLLDSHRCVVYLCQEDKNQVEILTFPRLDGAPHGPTKPLCAREKLIRNVLSTQQGDMINHIPQQPHPLRLPCTFGEAAQHVMLMPIKSSDSVFGVISVVRIGGDIDIVESSSVNTTFSITLPVAHTTPSQEPPHRGRDVHGPSAPTESATALPTGTVNVLIVEDEANWQGRLSLPFITQGWSVHRASSAEEAIRLIAQHAFAAFVVDVRLVHYDAGNVDGLQVVEHLRRHGRTGPVLLLSVWETSLQQARERFASWDNITICDKADEARLDAEIVTLATKHGAARVAQTGNN